MFFFNIYFINSMVNFIRLNLPVFFAVQYKVLSHIFPSVSKQIETQMELHLVSPQVAIPHVGEHILGGIFSWAQTHSAVLKSSPFAFPCLSIVHVISSRAIISVRAASPDRRLD